MMIIIAEFFVVILKVLWAFVTAGSKWIVRPKEKSVAGQVCVITGAGSGLGRLFAKEFARRRAILVLWDINSQSNEETAEMVRQIYQEVETPVTKDGKPVLFAAIMGFAKCIHGKDSVSITVNLTIHCDVAAHQADLHTISDVETIQTFKIRWFHTVVPEK